MSTPPDSTSQNPIPPGDSTTGADSSVGGAGLNPALLNKLKIRIPGYQLLDVIGRGGQATVYKAIEQSDSHMPVAIKVLHSGPLADPAARERLRREARAMKALIDSPNIVCVFDDGQTPEGIDYLVMNYIDGRPVDEFWKHRRSNAVDPEDPAAQLRLFKKICDAIGLAHRRGITHRDLSPSNILVDNEGEPHILDFGLARTAFDRNSPESHSISVTGQFLGKLAYASPEQALGNPKDVDIRTDVYALGVILYQIVTGGLFPYDVMGTLVEVLNNIIHLPPKPPSEALDAKEAVKSQNRRKVRPGIPPVNQVIEAIVLKALEKNPADRYESAGDLARDIGSYLSGAPTVARVLPSHSAARQLYSSRAAKLCAVSAASIAFVSAVVWSASRRSAKPANSNPIVVSASTRPTAIPPAATLLSASQSAAALPLKSEIIVREAPAPAPFTAPEIHGGQWRVEGSELVQNQAVPSDFALVFGEPAWSAYDLTFEARAQRGSHGFKALFHWKDEKDFCVFAVGNYFNAANDLSAVINGIRYRDRSWYKPGIITFNQWYSVRVEVRGPDVRCLLNGVEWFHQRDPGYGVLTAGRIGFGTYDSAVRFRSIRVTSPSGEVLFQGVPKVDLAIRNPRLSINAPSRFKTPPQQNTPATQPSPDSIAPAPSAGNRLLPMDDRAGTPSARKTPDPAASPNPPTAESKRVNLLAVADPSKDILYGQWTLEKDGLHSSGIEGETFQFPYVPPAEYDYKIVFVRTKGVQAIRMVCSRAGKQFMWAMGQHEMSFTTTGDPNPATLSGAISNQVRHTCVVSVRKGSVQAFLDGRVVSGFATDDSNLGIPAQFPRRMRNRNALGLDVLRSAITVESAEVIELAGSGRVLRQSP